MMSYGTRNILFNSRLDRQLAADGINVLAVNRGRGPNGVVWIITIQRADAVVETVHAPIAAGEDPDSRDVASDVARRIREHVSKNAV